MALTSCTTSARASTSWGWRARSEKSPSRRADRRLASVCNGRTTRSRSWRASHPQRKRTNRVTVHRSFRAWGSSQTKSREKSVPGRPVARARRRMRSSKASDRRRPARKRSRRGRRRDRATRLSVVSCGSEPMLLEPPVEGAAREAQRLGGLADVAVAGERLLDQHPLDLLQRQILQLARGSRGRRRRLQAQVLRPHEVAAPHEHAALDGVVELAYVARPRVALQSGDRRLLEAPEALAVALRVLLQELLGQREDVVAALAQGRNADLHRV